MELNSSIYQCKVYHERRAPKENAFAYNIYMFMIDLDELDLISKRFWTISRNRFNLFSFYDNDHFRKKNSNGFKETVREKLEIYLVENGVHAYPSRIKLLTSLRILGHVFNPVSFYYCYDENDVCFAVIAEVTNTYREMKMYLLVEHDQKFFYGSKKKLFYISPFTQLDDQLELKVGFPEDKLNIYIDDFKENTIKVKTVLSARKKKLTSLRLLNYFLKFPLLSIQVISLIHWQALKLWLKGVKYIPKNENLHLQKDIYYTKNEDTDVTNIVQKDRADIAEQDGARPTHA